MRENERDQQSADISQQQPVLMCRCALRVYSKWRDDDDEGLSKWIWIKKKKKNTTKSNKSNNKKKKQKMNTKIPGAGARTLKEWILKRIKTWRYKLQGVYSTYVMNWTSEWVVLAEVGLCLKEPKEPKKPKEPKEPKEPKGPK